MKFLVFVVLLVAAASAHDGLPKEHHESLARYMDKELRANMNEYFDNLLVQMRIYMHENGMVPMPLPDSKNGFSVKILFVTWHGELELTKGSVADLSTVTRRGDADLYYEGKKMIIRAEIGWDQLDMTYDYLAYIMNIGPDGRLHGRVKGLELNMAIEIDLTTNIQELKDLEVLHVGDLKVWLTGSIIMDQITNSIIAIFTSIFENTIVKIVMGVVKDAINAVLANTPLPTPPEPLEDIVTLSSGGIVNFVQKVRHH